MGHENSLKQHLSDDPSIGAFPGCVHGYVVITRVALIIQLPVRDPNVTDSNFISNLLLSSESSIAVSDGVLNLAA